MERPNHLNVQQKSTASKATSVAIVIAIHVAGIAGLVAALAQGALLKQLQEIKASVDTQKTPPKAPPPPPPDLVKPPPPVAIVPEFQVASRAAAAGSYRGAQAAAAAAAAADARDHQRSAAPHHAHAHPAALSAHLGAPGRAGPTLSRCTSTPMASHRMQCR